MQIQLQAHVQWNVCNTPDGNLVADCDVLGLTLQAENLAELAQVIEEGQHLLFSSLFEDGEFDSFLRAHGWTTLKPVPPNAVEDGALFTLPYDIIRERALGAA